ncbi:MAG: lipopolysaccharide biosynthesis protein RfbH [Phycisphaerae bacterium]|nr:lipopolysaccharide biosynthesis protein RfbH [Phycisphaerae bacterium]
MEKVKAYYQAAYGVPEPFVPGQSRIPYARRVFDAREMVHLVDASLEFRLTYGRYSQELEKRLAAFLGVRHCSLVNSGSSANLLAFMALTSDKLGNRRIRRGDEVITVAAAFPTTIAPIVQYGAVPVFVDVEIPTYNVDISGLEQALSDRTRAVMLAHTLGNPFDLAAVTEFCHKHRLWLIEDNCDALGSHYGGRLTGTFGDLGTSSFYPAHHMTLGEGGAVYTNDTMLLRVVNSLRDWGRDCWCQPGHDNTCGRRFSQRMGLLPEGFDHKYVYSYFGYNLKATDLQAAIGCAQLDKLPGFIDRRKENFRFLHRRLANLVGPLVLPVATAGSDPSWFGFPITVGKTAGFGRDELVGHLESKGIQTRPLFAGNVLLHPCCDGLRGDPAAVRVIGDLPNTNRIVRDTFWLGVYPGLTEEVLGYIAEITTEFVRAKGATTPCA